MTLRLRGAYGPNVQWSKDLAFGAGMDRFRGVLVQMFGWPKGTTLQTPKGADGVPHVLATSAVWKGGAVAK